MQWAVSLFVEPQAIRISIKPSEATIVRSLIHSPAKRIVMMHGRVHLHALYCDWQMGPGDLYGLSLFEQSFSRLATHTLILLKLFHNPRVFRLWFPDQQSKQ